MDSSPTIKQISICIEGNQISLPSDSSWIYDSKQNTDEDVHGNLYFLVSMRVGSAINWKVIHKSVSPMIHCRSTNYS